MINRFITILLLVIGLAAGPALFAQEQQPPTQKQQRKFFTAQACDDPFTMTDLIINKYGETPLFRGQGLQFHVNGQAYASDMMYFVNQNSGTWSLISLYPDGTACMVANGRNFEPYSGPAIPTKRDGT